MEELEGDGETVSVPRKQAPATLDDHEEAVPLVLLSDLYPEEIEQSLQDTLNELCPALQRVSPGSVGGQTLQHKALRVVMSTGMDVVVLDAHTSVALATAQSRIVLTSDDMLLPTETEDVFGCFGVPQPPSADDSDAATPP